MRRIRSKDTAPEMAVRRLVHAMGYRYRLHGRAVPGKPDLVFAGRRKVIFVHGCFWHQHPGCPDGRLPKSNGAYWLPKLERNVQRDSRALDQLSALGWQALVIWECETEDMPVLGEKLKSFLDS
ncbi:DNA mismatch endonuclease Vsr [Rhizobium leguminosarum bv. viciae]|nr:DNA mismatch endonuclease Vsr [Rhizobium leguminosarum bv. viciae]